MKNENKKSDKSRVMPEVEVPNPPVPNRAHTPLSSVEEEKDENPARSNGFSPRIDI